jgi:hypothetical protein
VAFLTINGIAWSIAGQGSNAAVLHVNEVGWSGRMIDGSYAKTQRAIKRGYKFRTIPLGPADCLALKNMLLGLGNHWSFDSSTGYLYSDVKGLTYDGQSGSTAYVTSSPTPKFGAGCLEILSGGELTFSRALTDQTGTIGTTASYVLWFWNGASWDGYSGSWTNGSAGTQYKNGVSQGTTIPGFLSLSSGLNLFGKTAGGSNANAYFDDLVILPYAARNADLQAWSQATSAFSNLPQLTLAGDVIESPWLGPCYASIEEADELMVSLPSVGFVDNAQIVSFSIQEA